MRDSGQNCSQPVPTKLATRAPSSTCASAPSLARWSAAAIARLAVVGPRDRKAEAVLAMLGWAFLVVRVVSTTASLAIAADDQRAKLGALAHVEQGARVASFVGTGCEQFWPLSRNLHLGGYVMVRRHGFSNDQWLMEGQNLLTIRYRAPGFFAYDRSEEVTPDRCPNGVLKTIDQSLAEVPREAFDYIWLIDVPDYDRRLTKGLTRVWQGAGSELYRVDRPAPPAQR